MSGERSDDEKATHRMGGVWGGEVPRRRYAIEWDEPGAGSIVDLFDGGKPVIDFNLKTDWDDDWHPEVNPAGLQALHAIIDTADPARAARAEAEAAALRTEREALRDENERLRERLSAWATIAASAPWWDEPVLRRRIRILASHPTPGEKT